METQALAMQWGVKRPKKFTGRLNPISDRTNGFSTVCMAAYVPKFDLFFHSFSARINLLFAVLRKLPA
ncbi:hypothetical protein B5G50_15470 [Brevibacillus brevis]|uniref:hypothetical protein n=1 Tax=Brevibacillus brevis TaxID=1393 RepID=UPI000B37D73B|nr:hypothetical protein [Brevibacillus brevis]OUQ87413.1 hypothetical protein B5G50_15470 [Brevibacillus brevis]